ncbi:MAG: DUF2905 domain-containing protein [Candidatus Aureabacteria bacterium]|nr:DUF2905 domain-containing protein [Candidatus Auribacterota bacterium]
MDELSYFGRILLSTGVILAIIGGICMLGGKLSWIGHLPGDVTIQRKGIRFYAPLGTCILLSILLTLILRMIRRN